jgi:hypothetical protein
MLPSENQSADVREEKGKGWKCKKIRERGDLKEKKRVKAR